MGRVSYNRGDRLASSIQAEIADLINFRQLKEFKNPLFQGLISITDVKVKNGHQHLDVYWSVFEEGNEKAIQSILEEATSNIRGHICRKCKLRFAPSLKFHHDTSIKRGCEMVDVLDKLNQSESDDDSQQTTNNLE
jgi:ribosome-binding factor A